MAVCETAASCVVFSPRLNCDTSAERLSNHSCVSGVLPLSQCAAAADARVDSFPSPHPLPHGGGKGSPRSGRYECVHGLGVEVCVREVELRWRKILKALAGAVVTARA